MAELTGRQIAHFTQRAQQAANAKGIDLVGVEFKLTPEGRVKVVSHYGPNSIERIRRVTGYFCKMSNCNEAKLQEISHRKTHEF